MADHSKPVTTSTYVNFVSELDARFDDLAVGIDPAVTTATNVPTNTVRWNSALNKWQKWNGTTWNDLSSGYAIAITGNAGTATTLATGRTINGTSFNGSANITTSSWGTSRTITIGGTGKAVDGSAAVTWLESEIAANTAVTLKTARTINGTSFNGSANITLDTVNLTGNQTVAGDKTFSGILSGATLREGSQAAVVQSDIGTGANEIPLNQYLGALAYLDEVRGDVSVTTLTAGGNASPLTGVLDPAIQNRGNSGATSSYGARMAFDNSTPPAYACYKSRGTLTAPTGVSSGDNTARYVGYGYNGTSGSFVNNCRIDYEVDGTPGATDVPGRIVFYTTPAGSTTLTERFRINAAGDALVTGSGGLGYGTGSGGTVTQATSRTTAVTINKTNGAITMFSAAGSTTAASFTVNNNNVTATDTIIVNQATGTNLYDLMVTAVAAGSFRITFRTTGGTSTDAPVINFAVIKAVTS